MEKNKIYQGGYFEGVKSEVFGKWLKRVVGRDKRFKHLLVSEYEEERLDFYGYFEKGLSPWQALQNEYNKYG